MKPKKMHSTWTPDEVRSITTEGHEVRADDEWFEHTVREWEHDGVDADVVRLARPLLEGTANQQRAATRLLTRIRDHWMDSGTAQMEMVGLLGREGVPMGRVPHTSQKEFSDAWDNFSGGNGNSSANFSFGHSDQTRREATRRGSDDGR